jgi:hypothetical protein
MKLRPIGKAGLLWDWVWEYLEAFWYIVERLFFVYSLPEVGEPEQPDLGSILLIYVNYFHTVNKALIQERFLRSERALEA